MTTLAMVPLEVIHWEQRYRTDLGDIETLVESIKEKGVLQPVTITPDHELMAGERRVTAARSAGLTHIPAIIREKRDAIDAREIELFENIHRKDFTWQERCNLTAEIDRLYKEKNIDWSGRKTAELMERGVASVSRDMQLAKAMVVIPELANYSTADEALKVLKKLEEDAIVHELRGRQIASQEAPGIAKGLQLMLKIADANYHIQDTFLGLAELRSNGAVHIIECDPPYGIDLNAQKKSKESSTSNVHSYEEVEASDYPAFLLKLAKELFRVAGQHCWLIFWFGPTWQREVLDALRGAGWLVDDIPAIWIKKQGQTMQPERYLGRAYEPFFMARKGTPVIMKRGRLNIFDYSTVPGTKKYHPTERPIPLIQEILETLGVPRQVVLVPFLGSGATLRAAYNCGMAGMGFDINPEYKDKFMLAVEEDTRAISGDTGEAEAEEEHYDWMDEDEEVTEEDDNGIPKSGEAS